MAWAEQLPSGKWRGVYRDSQGKRRRCADLYPRKSDALREANAAEAKERNNPTPTAASKLTWGEWEPQWMEARVVAESTKRSDAGRLRDHLRPHWGNEQLRSITADDVQRWVSTLQNNGLAPSTVQKCFHLLSASMKAAVKARLIDSNPCSGVDLPKPGPMPERYLEDDELEAITSSLDAFDQFAVALLVGTGMRLGEALGLHWESVDLKRQEIRVHWAYDPVAGVMKPPKDYQARVVPIGDQLATALSERLQETGPGGRPPVTYPPRARVHTGLVLAHTHGRPVDSSNLRHRFQASTRIAWVGSGKTRRRVGHARLHDLRHTYASRLLRAGVPLEEVSRLLGHGSITTTMRYAHLAQSNWHDVRKVLG